MKSTHAFAPRSLARAGGLNDASRSPPALHVLAGKLDSHLALALLSFLFGLVFFFHDGVMAAACEGEAQS